MIVGKLYPPGDPRRDSAFSIFYMGINLGAFLAPLICGYLGQRVGWHYGFGAAGVGMVISMAIFAAGQGALAGHGLRATPQAAAALPLSWRLGANERRRLGALAVLALLGNVVFWAAFEQAGSSMTLFAERSTDLSLPALDAVLPSSWLQSANPLFIGLLAPLFSGLWLYLARRGREPETPTKFAIAMLLVAAGFGVMLVAGARYDAGCTRVSMLWLLAAYFLNTCGELCMAPVGLAAVTRLAPPQLVSMVMGLWLASMALGNWLSGDFASQYDAMPKMIFFGVPMLGAAVAGLVLLLLARPLHRAMER